MVSLLLFTVLLNPIEKSFSYEYKNEINEVISNIETKCKKKIEMNIIYTWMPKDLEETYLKNEIARVNSVDKGKWIEFSSKFKSLSPRKKKLNLYHELGHVFGLEHNDKGIMVSSLYQVEENFKDYFIDLCPRINHK